MYIWLSCFVGLFLHGTAHVKSSFIELKSVHDHKVIPSGLVAPETHSTETNTSIYSCTGRNWDTKVNTVSYGSMRSPNDLANLFPCLLISIGDVNNLFCEKGSSLNLSDRFQRRSCP